MMMACPDPLLSLSSEMNIDSITARSTAKSASPLVSSSSLLLLRPNSRHKDVDAESSRHVTSTDRGKLSKPSKSSKRSKRTDDWVEITEPEERRRIQNRIAQRKFREKAREHKDKLERESRNQEHAGNAYRTPTTADFKVNDGHELSGLPWGCLSMTHIVAKGRTATESRKSKSIVQPQAFSESYGLPYPVPEYMRDHVSPYSSTTSTKTPSMVSGTWSSLFDHEISYGYDRNDMYCDYDMEQPSNASSTWLPLHNKHMMDSPDHGDDALPDLAKDTTLPISDIPMEDSEAPEMICINSQDGDTDLCMAKMTLVEESIEMPSLSRESTAQPGLRPPPTITLTSPSPGRSPEITEPIPASPPPFFNTTIQVSVERSPECESDGTRSEAMDESGSRPTTPNDDMDSATQVDNHRERAVIEMIDRVMDEFWILFDQDWDAAPVDSPAGGGAGGPPTVGGALARTSAMNGHDPRHRRRRGPLKRSREDGNESGDDQDEDPARAGESRPGEDAITSKKLACPYRKHDPFTYTIHNYKICALSPWPTIARLKEHLYRGHKVPPHCKRCWESFATSSELESHLMVPAAAICETKSGHSPEGITAEQIVQLRSRKKTCRTQTDQDRWRDIYRLLFPSQKDPPPSPYFEPVEDHGSSGLSPDSRDLLEYETFLRREIPRLVRSSLEQQAHVEIRPLEQALVESLPRIIQECQESAFQAYRKRNRGSSRSTEAGGSATPELAPASLSSRGSDSEGSDSQGSRLSQGTLGTSPSSQSGSSRAMITDEVLLPGIVEVAYRIPPSPEEGIMGLSAAQFEKPGEREQSDSGYGSIIGCQCRGPCVCWWDTLFDHNLAALPEPA